MPFSNPQISLSLNSTNIEKNTLFHKMTLSELYLLCEHKLLWANWSLLLLPQLLITDNSLWEFQSNFIFPNIAPLFSNLLIFTIKISRLKFKEKKDSLNIRLYLVLQKRIKLNVWVLWVLIPRLQIKMMRH